MSGEASMEKGEYFATDRLAGVSAVCGDPGQRKFKTLTSSRIEKIGD
jgi:hypothetical protein